MADTEEVKYLGHLFGFAGIAPLPSRFSDLKQFPSSKPKVGLLRYLDKLNYYRHFVLGLAQKLQPLHGAVASAKKPSNFLWSLE